VGIIKLGQNSLIKMVEATKVEIGEPIIYNVTQSNTGQIPYSGYRLLDVLPYHNDARGSKITGTYATTLEITFPTYAAGHITSLDVYELGAAHQGKTVSDITSGDLSAPTQTVTANAGVTTISLNPSTAAVYLSGTLGPQENFKIRIILTPTGNAGGNVYQNDATALTAPGPATPLDELFAPPVSAVVVSRTISGMAWEDLNRDGIRQNGDPAIENVKVTLYDRATGNIAKDIFNQNIAPVYTDSNGAYRFENLAVGAYYVRFEGNGLAFVIGDYDVTLKNIGAKGYRSVVDGAYVSSLLNSADTGDYPLPAKALIGPYGYNETNLDAGFYRIYDSKLEISKVLEDTDDDTAFLFTLRDGGGNPVDLTMPGVTVSKTGGTGTLSTNPANLAAGKFTMTRDTTVRIKGLIPGTYTVTEDAEGYDITYTVDGGAESTEFDSATASAGVSDNATTAVVFTNIAGGPILPGVGGIGTRPYLAAGTALAATLSMLLAGALIYRNRKRRTFYAS